MLPRIFCVWVWYLLLLRPLPVIGQLELSEPAQPITGSGRSKSRYQTQTQNILGSIQQNCSIWSCYAIAVFCCVRIGTIHTLCSRYPLIVLCSSYTIMCVLGLGTFGLVMKSTAPATVRIQWENQWLLDWFILPWTLTIKCLFIGEFFIFSNSPSQCIVLPRSRMLHSRNSSWIFYKMYSCWI